MSRRNVLTPPGPGYTMMHASFDNREARLAASMKNISIAHFGRSRRFGYRRTTSGIEFFDIKWTRDVEGQPEFHGHPASRVPRDVLKSWRDREEISAAEYRRFIKELPGC